MAQEIGESREQFGRDVWNMVEDFANKTKADRPYWIVYACKEDKGLTNKTGVPCFKQTVKAYYQKPPAILGILVWYVNHAASEFRFVPELSAPPDIPLDPNLLSTNPEDSFSSVAEQGQKLNVLVS